MSEWISVEERLPKTDELVLIRAGDKTFVGIYVHHGEHEGEGCDELEVGCWSDDEMHWYWPAGWYEQQINWEEFGWVKNYQREPDHWMPLPEPPK